MHIRSRFNPHTCCIDDAADVLADALLLARCSHLVHMDSNVSTAVALLSPTIRMVHVTELLRECAKPCQ